MENAFLRLLLDLLIELAHASHHSRPFYAVEEEEEESALQKRFDRRERERRAKTALYSVWWKRGSLIRP